MKCSFESTSEQGTTKGTSYLANESVRTDATLTTTSGTQTMSSIMDGTYLYSWGDGMPQGMKMRIAAMEEMSKNTQTPTATSKQVADLDRATDYDCATWSVDMSVFAPPTNITFADYEEMMKGMQGMMNGLGNDAGMMEGMESFDVQP